MVGGLLVMAACGGGSGPEGAVEGPAQSTQSLGESATTVTALPLPIVPAPDKLKAPVPVLAFSPSRPKVGQPVTLDATATEPVVAGYPLFYIWQIVSQPAGGSAWVAHQAGPRTFFVPDVPGVYEIYLAVNHDIAVGVTTTTITVDPADGSPQTEMPRRLTAAESMLYPTAVVEYSPAGPSTGSLVTLDGTRTELAVPDSPIYFDWQILSRPSGSQAVADDRSAGTMSFVADAAGDYTIYFAATQDASQAMVVGTITVH
jgi:hypothetical protein